jgi:CxxC-x17-CxxC domain-containing protein
MESEETEEIEEKSKPVKSFPVKPKLNTFKAICDKCGEKTLLSFIPDKNRPIYCKKCLKERREQRTFPPRPSFPSNNKSFNQEISLTEAMKTPPIDFRNTTKTDSNPKL